jgi:site-specific recombinase XerC
MSPSARNFRTRIARQNRYTNPLHTASAERRHSFAVHMLGLLLRQTIRALGEREDRQLTRAEVRRLIIGNPMRKLQLLLGHSDESTVYIYLDALDEAQEIVLAALAEWDAQSPELGPPTSAVPTG